jgi:hypothetical protein
VVPQEIAQLGFIPAVPLFAHISTNKYEFCMWPLGIRALCQHLRRARASLREAYDPLELAKREEDTRRDCMDTLGMFIEPANLRFLLAEAYEIVFSATDDRRLVNTARRDAAHHDMAHIGTRLGSWKAFAEEPLDADGVPVHVQGARVEIASSLAGGRIVEQLDRLPRFLAFLNTFIAMSIRGDATAAESSFVLSLCNLGYGSPQGG